MGTIPTRVPDDLEAELEAYLESERLDRSTAVRNLLAEGLEAWCKACTRTVCRRRHVAVEGGRTRRLLGLGVHTPDRGVRRCVGVE